MKFVILDFWGHDYLVEGFEVEKVLVTLRRTSMWEEDEDQEDDIRREKAYISEEYEIEDFSFEVLSVTPSPPYYKYSYVASWKEPCSVVEVASIEDIRRLREKTGKSVIFPANEHSDVETALTFDLPVIWLWE